MSFKFLKSLAFPIEKEIMSQERNYVEALKSDKTFEVLESIRQKIKMLKSELSEQRRHTQNGCS